MQDEDNNRPYRKFLPWKAFQINNMSMERIEPPGFFTDHLFLYVVLSRPYLYFWATVILVTLKIRNKRLHAKWVTASCMWMLLLYLKNMDIQGCSWTVTENGIQTDNLAFGWASIFIFNNSHFDRIPFRLHLTIAL